MGTIVRNTYPMALYIGKRLEEQNKRQQLEKACKDGIHSSVARFKTVVCASDWKGQ